MDVARFIASYVFTDDYEQGELSPTVIQMAESSTYFHGGGASSRPSYIRMRKQTQSYTRFPPLFLVGCCSKDITMLTGESTACDGVTSLVPLGWLR